MKKLKPSDFGSTLTVKEEAAYLINGAVAESTSNNDLVRKSSIFLVTEPTWLRYLEEAGPHDLIPSVNRNHRRELYGIPVRLTVGDSDATPGIQLVMEPKVSRR